MGKPKIFVASSSEAKDKDLEIRRILEECDLEPITWKEKFHIGEFGLESLINVSNQVDGAIIIATPDDKLWYRGTTSMIPRDNILFEAGLFIRALGRKKVALVYIEDDEGKLPKVPTDLSGLNLIILRKNKSALNEKTIIQWANEFGKLVSSSPANFDDINDILRDNFDIIPNSWKDEIKNYIIEPYRNKSKRALQGEFTLDVSEYYHSLLGILKQADENFTFRAISLLTPAIWKNDLHQKKFLEFNIEAVKRGARIKRLFISSIEQADNFWYVIKKQINNGIEIKVVSPRLYAEYNNLYDSIIVNNKTDFRSYVTKQFYDNPERLKGAQLIINETLIKEQIKSFDNLWDLGHLPSPKTVTLDKKGNAPPGNKLQSNYTEIEVTTCIEAAEARKVPLKNELKSLILETPSGLIVAHLPGDGELSLRAVKNALSINDIKLADVEILNSLDLLPGTVSAVLSPVWEMPHIISRRVLSCEFVTTNNGSRNGYFRFDPIILLEAENKTIGNFER